MSTPDEDFTEEDRRRSEVTVRELWEQAVAEGQTDFSYPEEPLDFEEIESRIGPERWAELRERRDAILAELEERRGDGGE